MNYLKRLCCTGLTQGVRIEGVLNGYINYRRSIT